MNYSKELLEEFENAPIKNCMYDNPNTMRREYWSNGKMLLTLSVDIFSEKDQYLPEWIQKERQVYPWNRGQLWGEKDALNEATKKEYVGNQISSQ